MILPLCVNVSYKLCNWVPGLVLQKGLFSNAYSKMHIFLKKNFGSTWVT